jgi:hypothetical protein
MKWCRLAFLLILCGLQAGAENLRRIAPQLEACISGDELSKFENYYSNATKQAFKPNPRCWAKNLDVSSCSIWNSSNLGHPTGTLVTPRHVIFATHYPMKGVQRLTFVSHSGETITRNLVSTKALAHVSGWVPDLSVGLLDEPIPTNAIMPAYILPAHFTNLLSATQEALPAVWLNQHKEVCIWEVSPLKGRGQVVVFPPKHERFMAYSKGIVYYDSGSPVYWFIDGRPVLLTVWTQGSGNNGVGTSVAEYADAVNRLIEELSPGEGYKLQAIDLGGAARESF